jgi:hypothetical protein
MILVVDSRVGKKVLLFDTSGNYRTQVGSQGNGHEQYNMPEDAVLLEDEIIVLSAKPDKLIRYKLNGEFIREYRIRKGDLGHPVLPLHIFHNPWNDCIYMRGECKPFCHAKGRGGFDQVFIADRDYRVSNSFGGFPEVLAWMPLPKSKSIAFDPNGNVWMRSAVDPYIEIYTGKGARIMRIDVSHGSSSFLRESDVEQNMPPERMLALANSKLVPYQVVNIANAFMMVSWNDPRNAEERWNIYGLDGQLLKRGLPFDHGEMKEVFFSTSGSSPDATRFMLVDDRKAIIHKDGTVPNPILLKLDFAVGDPQ